MIKAELGRLSGMAPEEVEALVSSPRVYFTCPCCGLTTDVDADEPGCLCGEDWPSDD